MSQQLETLRNACENYTGKNARQSGNGYRVPCPAHNGKKPSLYIADGDSRLIIHCHSHGCDPKDVLESVGLSIKDVYYQQFTPTEQRQHKTMINDRQLKHDLEIELLILLQWLSAFYQSLFPMGGEVDRERVILALKRVHGVTKHYMQVGVNG